MNSYPELKEMEEAIVSCTRCGSCKAVCPLFRETKNEATVARGKIQLAWALLQGKLEITARMEELFSLCLNCMACQANCPSGVETDRVVRAVRSVLVRKRGMPWLKKAAFNMLQRPELCDRVIRTGSQLQMMVGKAEQQRFLRFLQGRKRRFIVPSLAPKSLKNELPVFNRPQKKANIRAAFFTGCLVNYIYPDIGRSLVSVLNRNAVEVVIPPNQHCCGYPVLNSGDRSTAFAMAWSSLQIFNKEDFDVLITCCATCSSAWKKHYPSLLDNHYVAERIAAKVYDISEFLVRYIDKKIIPPFPGKVTYHDPCHLVRGLGVKEAPRNLLYSVPGLELIEMDQANQCCGGAGFFSIQHYDDASRIVERKVEAIVATGALRVITGCPACRMQLPFFLQQGCEAKP